MRIVCWIMCLGSMLCLLGADAPATAPATAPALGESLTIDLGNSVKMDFVLINAGSFVMGRGTAGLQAPMHKVTFAKPFYMGKYEVTQEQWMAVMNTDPSRYKGRKNPVESVSWDQCWEFLAKLSEKVPDRAFAMPTEAQWEYACAAGSTTRWSFGDPISVRDPGDLNQYVWRDGATHPVGGKKPNPWGLYDMHGNVWEWCADWHGQYPAGEAIDPTGPLEGTERVMRGGGFSTAPGGMGTTFRAKHTPDTRDASIGFRIVSLPGIQITPRVPSKQAALSPIKAASAALAAVDAPVMKETLAIDLSK